MLYIVEDEEREIEEILRFELVDEDTLREIYTFARAPTTPGGSGQPNPGRRYFDLIFSPENSCLWYLARLGNVPNSCRLGRALIVTSEGRQSPCWLEFVGVWGRSFSIYWSPIY